MSKINKKLVTICNGKVLLLDPTCTVIGLPTIQRWGCRVVVLADYGNTQKGRDAACKHAVNLR